MRGNIMALQELIKLDLRKKIILSFVGFFVFIFAIIFFIIIPAVRDIKNIGAEIEWQRMDLEKKYIKGQNLKNVSEKLKKAEEKIHVLDRIFVDGNNSLGFITAVEAVANNNNVDQKINLPPSVEAGDSLYQTVPLQIFSQGDFNQQLNYLIGLETLNYYINVKLLELSSGSDSVNLFLTADTYWRDNQGD